MPKAKRYDTVVLAEDIDRMPKGEKGAVVEAYTTPYEAYDVEIVGDNGETKGLLEGLRPEQIEAVSTDEGSPRFSTVALDEDGTRAVVSFSDGTNTTVTPEQLYPR